jgi:Carbohydrate binding domain (family 11).
MKLPRLFATTFRIHGALALALGLASAQTARADEGSLMLSDFETVSEWRNATRPELTPFTSVSAAELVKSGRASARWTHLARHKWIELVDCPADWSAYEALSLWLHSEKANGQVINLRVAATTPDNPEGYYLHQIGVDWTGWRQVVVPLSAFKKNRSPAPWSQVTGFRMSSAGWKATPLSDSVLHLDELRLIRR